ncbi:hypothetical protein PHYSODRAFT_332813 [Phytophthora sojae]|uniref:RXLR phytopathogen effector protein WY-domain domain-containing protein n=1 Tax=Phytophthora sojae (strain P6497) TaxID=1094619 RepID=G4ZQ33_PHYSP|nr:hypothetical protein PHYSODRAFT_332813 [Phytophthora sojae]EGZ14422.1 hypothetical protein PHYSODRAFT_332813 [Phytophthora sojae]|eukprot:XP_009528171.1 hypothetical protein PHYSODRAFT_332813 [Phytophthora sojae]
MWLKEKKTPLEVFNSLGLDTGTKNLLTNPKLKTWSFFVLDYNWKSPGQAASMTAEGQRKKNSGVRTVARALQAEQFEGWFLKGLPPDVVFNVLKLDKVGADKLLSAPTFKVWYNYFHSLNRYNTNKETDMIKHLQGVYNDVPLAKAIVVAKKDKATQAIATKLRQTQFQNWLVEGKTPHAIFQMLMKDRMHWTHEDVYWGYKAFYTNISRKNAAMVPSILSSDEAAGCPQVIAVLQFDHD